MGEGHYAIYHGCLYELIIKRLRTAVKHRTNHKKSTDIISMIVEESMMNNLYLASISDVPGTVIVI